jgi:hypothetical protein
VDKIYRALYSLLDFGNAVVVGVLFETGDWNVGEAMIVRV